MTLQIKSWGNSRGNSNGIRLNKEILTTLDVTTNDELELKIEDKKLIISPKRRPSLEEMFSNYEGTVESYQKSVDADDWLNMNAVGTEM